MAPLQNVTNMALVTNATVSKPCQFFNLTREVAGSDYLRQQWARGHTALHSHRPDKVSWHLLGAWHCSRFGDMIRQQTKQPHL